MKDQCKLLNDCIDKNIPVYMLEGRDLCAVEILKTASKIYKEHGCSKEYLYDFQNVIRGFVECTFEHSESMDLPDLDGDPKRNKVFLHNCLRADIPVIVFQGTDSCTIDILKAARSIYENYEKNNKEQIQELFGFKSNVAEDVDKLIYEFKIYQQSNIGTLKTPDLSPVEKEIILEEMESHNPIEIADFKCKLEERGFIKIDSSLVQDGTYILTNDKEVNSIVAKHGEYEFAINYGREKDVTSYYIFSNNPKYPEKVPDYHYFKACFADIMQLSSSNKNSPLANLISQYKDLGYNSIVENLHDKTEQFNLNLELAPWLPIEMPDIEICKSGAKTLHANMVLIHEKGEAKVKFDNLYIRDKSTSSIEPLYLNSFLHFPEKIEIKQIPASDMQRLLSGGKIDIKDTNNQLHPVCLHKMNRDNSWCIRDVIKVNTPDKQACM